MAIKHSLTGRTIRETSAEFEYNDPETGELKTEPMRIKYYSPTIADQKAERDAIKSLPDDDIYWFSKPLARRLHSLPDLLDDDGNPVAVTEELLEQMSYRNLEAIKTAIEKDLRPTTADEPSPAGSKAKAK